MTFLKCPAVHQNILKSFGCGCSAEKVFKAESMMAEMKYPQVIFRCASGKPRAHAHGGMLRENPF